MPLMQNRGHAATHHDRWSPCPQAPTVWKCHAAQAADVEAPGSGAGAQPSTSAPHWSARCAPRLRGTAAAEQTAPARLPSPLPPPGSKCTTSSSRSNQGCLGTLPLQPRNNASTHMLCWLGGVAPPSSSDEPAPPPPACTCRRRPGLRDSQGRIMLKNLTLPELEEWVESTGGGGGRTLRCARCAAPAARGCGVAGGAASQGRIPVHHLCSNSSSPNPAGPLPPGAGGQVETVLIPVVRESGGKPRITVCVSSQVGCAMNCQVSAHLHA